MLAEVYCLVWGPGDCTHTHTHTTNGPTSLEKRLAPHGHGCMRSNAAQIENVITLKITSSSDTDTCHAAKGTGGAFGKLKQMDALPQKIHAQSESNIALP